MKAIPLRLQCAAWTGGTTLLCLAVLAVVPLCPACPMLKKSIGFGLIVAWIVSLTSYLAQSWAWERSNRWFYGCYAGGVFLRLAALGVAAWAAYNNRQLSPALTLITLVTAMMVFMLWESRFLMRQNRAKKERQ
ncbi:MAG: hypothetical protein HY747_01270 [Elusimicrobia bacterium]|nr:hypothetical protein [Elusimicrobiota bacterium]